MRLVLTIALCLLSAPALAQDTSGNYMLPRCEDAIQPRSTEPGALTCTAIISALRWASPRFSVCSPQGVDTGQAVRVVVAYLRRHPERLHEDFYQLTVDAMHEAWPCKGTRR